MAKKTTTNVAKVVATAGPTPEAIKKPRRILFAKGVWIALGGDITMTVKPPGKDYICNQATPEQYLQLKEAGRFTNLIQ